MQVADGHRERIGGIVRGWNTLETQEQLDHLLNLLLLCAAIPDDGALDFGRRVLLDGTARFDRREHGDTSGVSEL
jgi:hypothetical protein